MMREIAMKARSHCIRSRPAYLYLRALLKEEVSVLAQRLFSEAAKQYEHQLMQDHQLRHPMMVRNRPKLQTKRPQHR